MPEPVDAALGALGERLADRVDPGLPGLVSGRVETGPFRPRHPPPGTVQCVFTGSGTQPGVGIPMVLISGRLAAARVTGY